MITIHIDDTTRSVKKPKRLYTIWASTTKSVELHGYGVYNVTALDHVEQKKYKFDFQHPVVAEKSMWFAYNVFRELVFRVSKRRVEQYELGSEQLEITDKGDNKWKKLLKSK